ncbi:beta-glucoside-specific PTS transporter subunit IIABC [Gracilibacillus alcaliphilus]|uniref:beta-glucoside-specific PTS transporter subunit IIABC n=1 Tax=Gracilibacillus alcaliphilus TaxID=1401441 RepID=UPI0019599FB8|nr:beta-glucoside-specific PTS transporter subunit IIABC [Gracilibacillus alcaliphilus]MBM7675539.1 PTS system beta-glucosides-specific IIC component [Gracilibacillus alcaliphilus]
MKYEQLAKDIIKYVGGKENVISLVHCITRLRFKLRDESKADTEALKNMDGVVTVMKSGGQYQVVIGNHVPDVYADVMAVGGFQAADAGNEEEEQQSSGNLLDKFVDIISSIFTPVLGVLAATGMIKGFNALFVALGWMSEEGGTFAILNAVGDAFFYFFPIFLGYTAMKKFGGTPFMGMVIGASLVYPTIAEIMAGEPRYTLFAGTIFESPIHIEFLGIPVILMSYSTSVVPIILATFFGAKVEKFFRKVIPDVVKTFLVPFFTFLVIVPLTFLLIGPVATWAANMVGSGINTIFNLSPLIAGIVIGAFWQILVIFGLHWGLIPLSFLNLDTLGYDPILSMIFAASFAQIGAVLGVWIKTKEQSIKTLSIPAFISGVFGVTEPAIYGVTLPKKRPFIISCIGAAVGGGILGFFGTKLFTMGGLGIFMLPSMIGPDGMDSAFWGSVIAMLAAFGLTFVLTYLFGMPQEPDTATAGATTAAADAPAAVTEDTDTEIIASPLTGDVLELSSIKDETFASGLMGKGLAIEPAEGRIVAPAGGTISAFFPTKHAIGITTDYGTELLIHVGMDTVNLNGQFFTGHVEQGDHVNAGDLLIEFDIEQIKKAGYLVTTPVIVTNPDKYQSLIILEKGKVNANDELITLTNNEA